MIYFNKQKKMPTLNNFLYLVKLNYKIDKYNAVKKQTQPACEKKWGKYCFQWYRSYYEVFIISICQSILYCACLSCIYYQRIHVFFICLVFPLFFILKFLKIRTEQFWWILKNITKRKIVNLVWCKLRITKVWLLGFAWVSSENITLLSKHPLWDTNWYS